MFDEVLGLGESFNILVYNPIGCTSINRSAQDFFRGLVKKGLLSLYSFLWAFSRKLTALASTLTFIRRLKVISSNICKAD